MKKQTKTPSRTIPSPAELLAKAEKVAAGFSLWDYHAVMLTLREKGMTFRAIAAWLSSELGRPITHIQVYRMLQADPNDNRPEAFDDLLRRELIEEDKMEEKEGQS